MQGIWLRLQSLWYGGEERGQTMAEYAFILGFVALVVIAAVTLLGTSIRDYYNTFRESMP